MGRTNEFTLVADSDFSEKLGCAVVVKAELVDKTPVGTIAEAGKAIDGIVTDITAGKPQVLAIARIGDIAFAKLGEAVTVGDELVVGEEGALAKAGEGVAVAKALATGAQGERIPVLIK
jgi:hypothetical protein